MGDAIFDSGRLRLITFDCYGTLIDWESGIRQALGAQLAACGLSWKERHFQRYLEIESRLQCTAYRPYREILNAAETELLRELGVTAGPKPRLAKALPGWQPFDDTVAALRRLKQAHPLGILSNIDRDLFAKSARLLPVAFDVVITAEDVRYYKPGTAHFERLLQDTGLAAEQVLHVAQSRFHDIQPCLALHLPCVWINRRGESAVDHEVVVKQFPDLKSFADALLNDACAPAPPPETRAQGS